MEDELLDGTCYISTVNYHKQAQDELSLHEGQVVCVVDDSDRSESSIDCVCCVCVV